MKQRQIALAILAILYASLALAEDFKTISGKEYKDAKVSRVEPDGIVLKTKSGISKVYFAELPQAVQKRFQHDSAQGSLSPPTNRQKWHKKTQHSQSIVLEEPLINSLPGTGRHNILRAEQSWQKASRCAGG